MRARASRARGRDARRREVRARGLSKAVAAELLMQCPFCTQPMLTDRMREVEVERCPGCGTVYLEARELAANPVAPLPMNASSTTPPARVLAVMAWVSKSWGFSQGCLPS